jgi:hypothetical protein
MQTSSILRQAVPIKFNDHYDFVGKLLGKLKKDYGKRFTDQWKDFSDQQIADNWLEALYDYSIYELMTGYVGLRDKDWPPSIPEFLNLCRTKIDYEKAYWEALGGIQARQRGEVGTWSHPAIFFASTGLYHDILNLPYDKLKSRWEMALDRELSKNNWPNIPVPPKQITNDPKITKEEAEKMMREINDNHKTFKTGPKDAWFKGILDRHKKGDKSLLPVQIQFAIDAARNSGYKY